MLRPVARTSNEAAYKLLCGSGSAGGVTVSAAVQPAARAETVTYYWARSNGADSAPATLTFTGPAPRR